MFGLIVSGPIFDDPKFNKCVWSEEEYGCKEKFVDDDHQVLFDLINGITTAAKSGNINAVKLAIQGCKEYTNYHFDREIYMLANLKKYPPEQLKAHIAAHGSYVRKIEQFEKSFNEDSVAGVVQLVSGEIITYLNDWLASHIQATDMHFHEYFD